MVFLNAMWNIMPFHMNGIAGEMNIHMDSWNDMYFNPLSNDMFNRSVYAGTIVSKTGTIVSNGTT